jgi:hypothetical protein
MQKVAISQREQQYKMQEYNRSGWTFHAKGNKILLYYYYPISNPI